MIFRNALACSGRPRPVSIRTEREPSKESASSSYNKSRKRLGSALQVSQRVSFEDSPGGVELGEFGAGKGSPGWNATSARSAVRSTPTVRVRRRPVAFVPTSGNSSIRRDRSGPLMRGSGGRTATPCTSRARVLPALAWNRGLASGSARSWYAGLTEMCSGTRFRCSMTHSRSCSRSSASRADSLTATASCAGAPPASHRRGAVHRREKPVQRTSGHG